MRRSAAAEQERRCAVSAHVPEFYVPAGLPGLVSRAPAAPESHTAGQGWIRSDLPPARHAVARVRVLRIGETAGSGKMDCTRGKRVAQYGVPVDVPYMARRLRLKRSLPACARYLPSQGRMHGRPRLRSGLHTPHAVKRCPAISGYAGICRHKAHGLLSSRHRSTRCGK